MIDICKDFMEIWPTMTPSFTERKIQENEGEEKNESKQMRDLNEIIPLIITVVFRHGIHAMCLFFD